MDRYWNRILLCSHLPHWYKGTSKKSELRNHHNGSYGRVGNKKDISFSNNGHAKTIFCVRKADNTVELKAARLCDCFLVLHLIYLQEVYYSERVLNLHCVTRGIEVWSTHYLKQPLTHSGHFPVILQKAPGIAIEEFGAEDASKSMGMYFGVLLKKTVVVCAKIAYLTSFPT